MARLQEQYKSEIVPALQERFGFKSAMEIPRITKITLNMGLGEAVANKNVLQSATADLEKITGQKPVVTKAKKSEANFKIREGWPIGAKVTLRRDRMYEFMDRLVNIALPRVRDFRGLNGKSFDGNGNYAMGLKEHIVFPEINYDSVDSVLGMDIVVQTSANTDEEAKALLAELGFPFRN